MSFTECSEILFESCLNAFGEEVEYLSKDGQSFTLSVVFTKVYEAIAESQFDTVVSSSKPALEVAVKELKCKPKAGDQIIIRDEKYRVVEVEPNNEGQIKLILKKVEKK